MSRPSPQIGEPAVFLCMQVGLECLGWKMKTNELHRTKRILRRALPLALLLGLLIVVPVLADYLGPDRTETTYVYRRKRCHYNGVNDPPGPGYDTCYLNLYTTPGGSCPSNVASYFNHASCGGDWPDSCGAYCSISLSTSIESCNAGDDGCRSVAQTVTHPPATISGSINCPQTGDNGYCTAAASLSLSGNEPLSGYSIIALEGTRNGETFLWDGSSCTIQLLEGANEFTYWALSDWGDSSLLGSASRSVDTRPPSVSASASGTPGNGSWYVSAVTIEASASDPSPGSDLDSFQASVDGSGWSAYSEPITLNDGDHTVELLATDNAGWTDSASMAFQIDTIAPTTVISDPTGTWATGAIDLSGVSNDLHLDGAEISTDGGNSWSGLSLQPDGSWSTTWDTRTVSNGNHSVQARARDLAGNVGGAAAVAIQVDNGAPQIGIPASWPIWQRVAINVKDNGIGVKRVRLTIHSDEYGERVYNWSRGPDDFKWDRRFGDIIAPIGGYPVEVEAWDEAGNKGSAWGEIVIPEPDEVEQEIEEEPAALSVEPPEEPSEPPSSSGGEAPVPPPTKTPKPPKVVTFGGESSGVEEIAEEEIAPEADSSNVLWGAAAVAAVGSAMAVVAAQKKKRKDEEKKKAAAAAMFNQQQIALEKKREQKAAQRKWEAEQEAEMAKAALEAQIIQESLDGIVERGAEARAALEAQIIQESLDGIAERGYAEERAAAQAQVIQESLAGIAARGAATKEEDKSWWEKAIDWVDEHQSTIALAAGIVVGAVAVVVSGGGALPVVATWLGGMTLVSAGTVGLNAYYGRPLDQNVLKNVVLTGVSAVATTGVGLVIQAGGLVPTIYKVGQMGAAFCTKHPTACQNAEFALKAMDTLEEVSLVVQGTVQSIMGNEAGAAQTALELQWELQDGGIPGNSFANEAADLIKGASDEVADIISKYGDDLAAILAKHGDDAIDLIERYGDEAAEFLAKYGDEGFDLLSKHGDDAIDLIGQYGEGAANFLTQYGDEGLDLLSRHGEDAIDLIGTYGDDAADILTQYGDEGLDLLSKHGQDAIDLIGTYGDDAADILTKYGDEGLDLLSKHGEDAIDLIGTYGDDAADILTKYGDEGLDLLSRHGDDAIDLIGRYGDDAADILTQYGDEGFDLLSEHGDEAINWLNDLGEHLDDDVLGNVVSQGSEAVETLSKWNDDLLKKFGTELAERAGNDSVAIDAAATLAKLAEDGDLYGLTALDSIETIGANSVQGSGDRFVIGNWIDYDSGYMGDWHMDGGLCYNTHPDVYNILEQALPEDELDDVLAAINQAALSDAISDNIDFDYSLIDLPDNEIRNDIAAIKLMETGDESGVLDLLRETTLPGRMEEVKMLLDAGYTYEVDLLELVIRWTNPSD